MPVLNDEYGYIGKPDRFAGWSPLSRDKHRNIIWGIAMAGGYGAAGDVRVVVEDGLAGAQEMPA